MQIVIKASNMELTDAIRQYVDEKLVSVARLVEEKDPSAMVEVEVGKSTQHHNKGPFMRCEMNLTFLGDMFRAVEEREDLYESIDVCRDELRRQVVKDKDRVEDERHVSRPDKE